MSKGEIVVACDRCLDDMTLPIDSDYQVVIKYSDNPSDDNDEVIEVAENVRDYDLTDLIYDSIALEIPMKHRHADGQCNPEMIEKLLGSTAYEDEKESNIDPRWNALRDIIDNNKK